MTKEAIITIGVSASGKTTYAQNYIKSHPDYRIICRDDIRWDLMTKNGLEPCWANWNWKHEKQVTDIQNELIVQYYNDLNVNGIIIANTNLNPKYLDITIKELEFVGYTIQKKYFPISWVDACKRNAARPHGINISILAQQFEQWNLIQVPQYIPNETLPIAVVCDIDGTISHSSNLRGIFDWNKVNVDLPDIEVMDILKGLANKYKIVILSGRDSCCRELTEQWLKKYLPGINFSLFMRPAGSIISDDIVKHDLFFNNVANQWNVKMVIDDRSKVCRLWRSIGLKVLQCGNPYIEF